MSQDLLHVPEAKLRAGFEQNARGATDLIHGACAELVGDKLNEFIGAFAKLCMDMLETPQHRRSSVQVPERFERLWPNFWGRILTAVDYERERDVVLAIAIQQLMEVLVERFMHRLQQIQEPAPA